MANRTAEARWEGTLKNGGGMVRTESGALDAAYSFKTRFEDEKGTNPEELIGAAHAGCFSMALAHILEESGHDPRQVDTKARVTLAKKDEGFRITAIELDTTVSADGLDEETLEKKANEAKVGCPVSVALAGTDIQVKTHLK